MQYRRYTAGPTAPWPAARALVPPLQAAPQDGWPGGQLGNHCGGGGEEQATRDGHRWGDRGCGDGGERLPPLAPGSPASRACMPGPCCAGQRCGICRLAGVPLSTPLRRGTFPSHRPCAAVPRRPRLHHLEGDRPGPGVPAALSFRSGARRPVARARGHHRGTLHTQGASSPGLRRRCAACPRVRTLPAAATMYRAWQPPRACPCHLFTRFPK